MTHLINYISQEIMAFFQLLSLLLFCLPSPTTSLPTMPSPFARPSPLCHPHESTALLDFKNSFSIFNFSSYFSLCAEYYGIANPNSTMSWNMSRDCCTWSGVTCDEVTGHVIRLELGCSGLQGIIHSNNSLFLLTHLQTLILSHNNLSGQVPPEFSYLSRLITLDLRGWSNDLRLETFSLKRIVTNLTSLRELSLNRVNMSSVACNSFMNLSESLISLDLSDTEMKGEFPVNIFLLPNLKELDLSYNYNLTGSFPRYNWTTPLRNLSLSSTRFLIDLPYLTKSLKYLNHLDASNCSFSGSFLALMRGNITQITSLDLSFNSFGGQIPWDSLNLEKLNFLNLAYNNFEGQLPQICSNSTRKTFLCDSSESDKLVGPLPFNLKSLLLFGNLLNDTLPSWLYFLPSLQDLYLSDNQFTGHISEFQYNSLVNLDLSSNKLEGLIPRSIFQQANLRLLYLSSNNLSGVIHLEQFSRLKKLESLYLSSNSLSVDSINSTTYVLPSTLQALFLSSCNITGFPYSLRSLENLEFLDLSNNRIDGSVPQWLWNVGKDSLYYLNISHNLLTHIGKIPWKSLSYIDFSSNRLEGHLLIPPTLTYLFSISNNQLVGEISSFFCNLTRIQVLDLSNNNLSGNIPPCVGKGSLNLRNLKLHGNQLEGPLPQSLVNCEGLEILDVGNNKLDGSFPHWLESLPKLQVLILRSNRLSGPLSNPKVRFPFQKLRIMDISNNDFTGTLPTKYFENFVAMIDAHSDHLEYMGEGDVGRSYYSVTVVIKGFGIELVKIQKLFITLDFSRNNFTGEIPTVIGKLNSLKGLNFSHNKLSGHIPPSLGNLSNLEWLDLSSNELFGNIPLQLATDLYQLQILNLSDNKLEGPIPRGRQFDTFNNDSYSENVGLCGFPLSKSCSNDGAQQDQGGDDDGDHNNGMIDWKVVMMGYGSGTVIGISVGYMVLFSRSFNYWFHKRFRGGGRRKTNARLRWRRRSN